MGWEGAALRGPTPIPGRPRSYCPSQGLDFRPPNGTAPLPCPAAWATCRTDLTARPYKLPHERLHERNRHQESVASADQDRSVWTGGVRGPASEHGIFGSVPGLGAVYAGFRGVISLTQHSIGVITPSLGCGGRHVAPTVHNGIPGAVPHCRSSRAAQAGRCAGREVWAWHSAMFLPDRPMHPGITAAVPLRPPQSLPRCPMRPSWLCTPCTSRPPWWDGVVFGEGCFHVFWRALDCRWRAGLPWADELSVLAPGPSRPASARAL